MIFPINLNDFCSLINYFLWLFFVCVSFHSNCRNHNNHQGSRGPGEGGDLGPSRQVPRHTSRRQVPKNLAHGRLAAGGDRVSALQRVQRHHTRTAPGLVTGWPLHCVRACHEQPGSCGQDSGARWLEDPDGLRGTQESRHVCGTSRVCPARVWYVTCVIPHVCGSSRVWYESTAIRQFGNWTRIGFLWAHFSS